MNREKNAGESDRRVTEYLHNDSWQVLLNET